MAHFVICKYCGQRFNRDVEPFVEVGSRRYAHKDCADKVDASMTQEEKDYYKLEEYIKKLFSIDTISAKIKKQIHDFRQEYGYTYSGMLKTLYWWYEIKDNSIELSQEGIGIVPFVYNQAEKYFYALYMAKMFNDGMEEYKPKVEEVEIASPRVYTQNQIRLFDMDEDD